MLLPVVQERPGMDRKAMSIEGMVAEDPARSVVIRSGYRTASTNLEIPRFP